MKQRYIDKNFTPASVALIETIDGICRSYSRQGFVLTVRQLYYQLVARNIIPNNERSYKNTTALVNDARLAGYIDWDAIEDRTRAFISRPRWGDGKHFIDVVAPQYHSDPWEGQDARVFCIIEKEALVGVLEDVCREFDVPLLAARGYPSVSVLREFARREILPRSDAQNIYILHLGDHDPSGIDMTRDLVDRLRLLCGGDYCFDLERIALNMDQIEENNCPPNPAKLTDSRSNGYVDRFGYDSWELDALEPALLVDLVRTHIEQQIDEDTWARREEEITSTRERLVALADDFE
jgi:hypothetical protein